MVRQTHFQFIQNVMLGSHFNRLVAEGLLSFADILCCELCTVASEQAERKDDDHGEIPLDIGFIALQMLHERMHCSPPGDSSR